MEIKPNGKVFWLGWSSIRSVLRLKIYMDGFYPTNMPSVGEVERKPNGKALVNGGFRESFAKRYVLHLKTCIACLCPINVSSVGRLGRINCYCWCWNRKTWQKWRGWFSSRSVLGQRTYTADSCPNTRPRSAGENPTVEL